MTGNNAEDWKKREITQITFEGKFGCPMGSKKK